jgi:hypothetical protein
MQGYTFFNDLTAAVLAIFTLPEIWCFHNLYLG